MSQQEMSVKLCVHLCSKPVPAGSGCCLVGSHGVLQSGAGPGCLASSAFNVSCVSGAGVSSEQTIRIAALKLPASILLVTAAANLLVSDILLAALLAVCCAGSASNTPLSHDAVLLLMTLLRFLLTPPLFGLARITGPKWSNSLQADLSFGELTIRLSICVNSSLQAGLAARGMRLTSVFHCGCESSSAATLADCDAGTLLLAAVAPSPTACCD